MRGRAVGEERADPGSLRRHVGPGGWGAGGEGNGSRDSWGGGGGEGLSYVGTQWVPNIQRRTSSGRTKKIRKGEWHGSLEKAVKRPKTTNHLKYHWAIQ